MIATLQDMDRRFRSLSDEVARLQQQVETKDKNVNTLSQVGPSSRTQYAAMATIREQPCMGCSSVWRQQRQLWLLAGC
jgi:hypothetical protein